MGSDELGRTVGLGVLFVLFAVVLNLGASEILPPWALGGEGLGGPAGAVAVLVLIFVAAAVYLNVAGSRSVPSIMIGITVWVTLPALISSLFARESENYREWWATGWYWSLKPLPVDFEGPTGWTPAVEEIDGAQQTAMLVVQAATVVLALGALGAIVRRVREVADVSAGSGEDVGADSDDT